MVLGPATTRATASEALQDGKALKRLHFLERRVARKGVTGAFLRCVANKGVSAKQGQQGGIEGMGGLGSGGRQPV
jgi:hypothetical protein